MGTIVPSRSFRFARDPNNAFHGKTLSKQLVKAVAASGATMLILASGLRRRGPWPRGNTFGPWQLPEDAPFYVCILRAPL